MRDLPSLDTQRPYYSLLRYYPKQITHESNVQMLA